MAAENAAGLFMKKLWEFARSEIDKSHNNITERPSVDIDFYFTFPSYWPDQAKQMMHRAVQSSQILSGTHLGKALPSEILHESEAAASAVMRTLCSKVVGWKVLGFAVSSPFIHPPHTDVLKRRGTPSQ